MLEAGLWAFLGQATLVLGAVLSLLFAVKPRALGLIAGFGAGTLVAAAAFELSVPAFREPRAARSSARSWPSAR